MRQAGHSCGRKKNCVTVRRIYYAKPRGRWDHEVCWGQFWPVTFAEPLRLFDRLVRILAKSECKKKKKNGNETVTQLPRGYPTVRSGRPVGSAKLGNFRNSRLRSRRDDNDHNNNNRELSLEPERGDNDGSDVNLTLGSRLSTIRVTPVPRRHAFAHG